MFGKLWGKLTGNELPGEDPFSIVLLLREDPQLDQAALQAAAEKAFGEVEACVLGSKGRIAMVKVGSCVLNVIQAAQPYDLGIPEQEVLAALEDDAQRTAWQAHRAWLALDVINKDIRRKQAYRTLAQLALALGDANCTGVYFPKDGGVRANNGSAEAALRELVKRGAQ